MPQIDLHFGRDPAFGPFLAASVGEDASGQSVSVLSMLARLDVDPWKEASDLSLMAHAPALLRLDALLARFRDVPDTVQGEEGIGTGLLGHLPKHTPTAQSPATKRLPRFQLPPVGTKVVWIILISSILGWVLVLAQT